MPSNIIFLHYLFLWLHIMDVIHRMSGFKECVLVKIVLIHCYIYYFSQQTGICIWCTIYQLSIFIRFASNFQCFCFVTCRLHFSHLFVVILVFISVIRFTLKYFRFSISSILVKLFSWYMYLLLSFILLYAVSFFEDRFL